MTRLDLSNAVERFGAHSIWIGVALLVTGFLGALMPIAMSEFTIMLVAVMMISGGVLWAWHSAKHGASWVDWIKPLALLLAGGLVAYEPFAGIASVALLVAVYLAMDAVASFSIVRQDRKGPGRRWMVANGIADVLLLIAVLWGWPQSSLWTVGLFAAISLVLDGWALVMIGWSLRHRHSSRDSS
ncbi:MAG: DUF308 domain-containing protein [Chromatiaceae bacterium]|nr:DUF308 domain-containing protein [Chromatiaceae bacterium]MCP5314470.1 DUF308 domain-containing protein [Chromatiaceae bacterium]